MNISYSKHFLFIVALFLSPEVFAAGLFDVLPTDKSLEYLGIIFGGSVGAITLSGDANPMLSKMFERFNFIVVTIGVTILSYIAVAAAINTAREGEAMGKKFSLWVPLRAMLGMLLMVPSPGTGYSVVQMTVMWVVLNGIGAANTIWGVVLDQLGSGIKAVGNVDVPIDITKFGPTVQQVFRASTCMQVMNTVPNKLVQDYGRIRLITSYGTLVPAKITKDTPQISRDATIHIGNDRFPDICGNIRVSTLIMNQDPNNSFNLNSLNARLAVKVNAVLAMFSVVEPATAELSIVKPLDASDTDPDPPVPEVGYLQQAVNGYKAQIVNIASGVNLGAGGGSAISVGEGAAAGAAAGLAVGGIGGAAVGAGVGALGTYAAETWEKTNDKVAVTSDQVTAFKRLGWIHAGSYYYAMSKSGGGTKIDQDATTNGPTPENIPAAGSSEGILSDPPKDGTKTRDWIGTQQLYTELQTIDNRKILRRALVRTDDHYNKELANYGTSNSLPALGSGKVSSGNGFVDQVLGPISDGMRAPIIKMFQSDLTGKSEDPLISIGKYGWEIMLGGELSIFVAIVAAFWISMAASPASCMNPAAYAANQLLIQLFVVIFTFLALLWTLGATMGVYMPLIPYIVFTGTAVGWLIAVIEAIVAAPLIALAMVQPGGEEIGEIKQALLILANLFLRPALMIFGFVIAGSFLRAILTMLNFGFARAVEESVIPTLFGIIPILGIYAGFVVALINQAFALIYELPNKVMRYMGHTEGGYTPSGAMEGAKKGADQGTAAASGAMKAAGGAAQGVMKAKLEKGRSEYWEKEKEKKGKGDGDDKKGKDDKDKPGGDGGKKPGDDKPGGGKPGGDLGSASAAGGTATGSGSMAGASDASADAGASGGTDATGGGADEIGRPDSTAPDASARSAFSEEGWGKEDSEALDYHLATTGSDTKGVLLEDNPLFDKTERPNLFPEEVQPAGEAEASIPPPPADEDEVPPPPAEEDEGPPPPPSEPPE